MKVENIINTMDDDDILNIDIKDTLKMEEMGIDVNYLVKYVGGGED